MPPKQQVSVALLVDRLAHAADGPDASSSLDEIKARTAPIPPAPGRRGGGPEEEDAARRRADEVERRRGDVVAVAQSEECLRALFGIVGDSRIPPPGDDDGGGGGGGVHVEDGPPVACEIVLNLLAPDESSGPGGADASAVLLRRLDKTPEGAVAKTLLAHERPAPLLDSLLDLLCGGTGTGGGGTDGGHSSPYARILAMEILRRLIALQPSLTQDGLLRAPDGLNRLVDLLSPDVNDGANREEAIRNEALVMLTDLARLSPVVRRLLVFAEGFERALSIATAPEERGGAGGLTGGNVVVRDCLALCRELAREDGAELLLGSRAAMNMCCALIDARWGREVLHPPVDDEDDDAGEKKAEAMSMEDLLKDYADGKPAGNKGRRRRPRLTVSENDVVSDALALLAMAVGDDDGGDAAAGTRRRRALAGVDPICRLVLGLALFREGDGTEGAVQFVAAAPSEETQVAALTLLATLCSDDDDGKVRDSMLSKIPMYPPDAVAPSPTSPPPAGVVDDLMALCRTCPSMMIVAPALAALRSLVTAEAASLAAMHALAPPPEVGGGGGGGGAAVPSVKAAMDALAGHLSSAAGTTAGDVVGGKDGYLEPSVASKICGACGALGIILKSGGETARELLLRITVRAPPAGGGGGEDASLLNVILTYVERCAEGDDKGFAPREDDGGGAPLSCAVRSSVSRLLCDWCDGCPAAVGALVAIPESVRIPDLILSQQRDNGDGEDKSGAFICERGLASLLLGLCLEYIGDSEHAGWSRAAIIGMIKAKIGVSRFTTFLEGPRQSKGRGSQSFGAFASSCWGGSSIEAKVVSTWYSACVEMVRKRLVAEITGGFASSEQNGAVSSALIEENSFAVMVKQQEEELEELRGALKHTKTQISLKESECRQWRRRCESSSSPDDALSRQIEIAVAAEKSATELQDKLAQKDGELEQKLGEKDALIDELRNEIAERKQCEATAKEDAQSMTEELKALSQAYSDLEGEFRRAGTVQSDTSNQAKGENPHQAANMSVGGENEGELASLRAQVEELRSTSRAADEWMAMAVQRMQALSDQNTALSSRLQSNGLQVDAVSAEPADQSSETGHNSVDLELVAAKEKNSHLERQLEETRKELDVLRTRHNSVDLELVSAKENSSHLERQLEETLKELEVLRTKTDGGDSAEGEKKSQPTEHEEELVSLRTANAEAQAWMANAVEHHEYLNGQIETLTADNVSLKDQLEALQRDDKEISNAHDQKMKEMASDLEAVSREKDSALSTIDALRLDLETAQAEVSRLNTQAEQIRTAANQSGSDDAVTDNGDLVKAQREISLLRGELSTKEAFFADLQTSLSDISLLKEKTQRAEDELSQCNKDNADLREQSRCENERLQDLLKESELRLSELERQRSDAVNQEVSDLKAAQESLQLKMAEVQKECDILMAQRDSAAAAEAELTTKLTEFQDWTETAQEKIAELENDKVAAEKILEDALESSRESEEKVLALESSLATVESERDEMLRKVETIASDGENLQREMLSMEERYKLEVAQLEERQESLKSEKEDALERIVTCEENVSSLEMHNSEMSERLVSLQQDLTAARDLKTNLSSQIQLLEETSRANSDRMSQQEETIQHLESQIARKVEELVTAKDEMSRLKVEMEQNKEVFETESAQLKDELAAKVCEMEQAAQLQSSRLQQDQERMNKLQADIADREEALASANDEVASLTRELLDVGEESSDVVNRWKERSELLEATVEELQGNVQELEFTVEELEKSSQEQLEGANNAIAQWEDRCSTLNEELEKLQESLSAEQMVQQEEKIKALELALSESMLAQETLRHEMERRSQEASSKKNIIQQSMLATEAAHDELLQTLADERDAAAEERARLKDATSKTEKLDAELKAATCRNDELVKNLKDESTTKAQLEDELTKCQEAKSNVEKMLENENKTVAETKESLLRAAREMEDKSRQWDKERAVINERAVRAEREVSDCQAVIGQLQGELRDAYETLQSRVTDEISAQATEKATDALRSQIRVIRAQLASDRENATKEQEARLLAERQVEELRADLVFLANVEGDSHAEIDTKIKSLVSRATEERMRQERREMEELKASLEQALQELSASKACEREAEEQAATARLAASLSEKEAAAAKSDIARLTSTIERLHDHETDAMSSLRSRVDSLSENRALLSKSHKDEMNSLKAELNHTIKEKDRLLHALHQVESANATLISSGVNNMNGGGCNETELTRLRIEKAHLLTSLSESAAKTEQRIRGVVTAHSSASDAELILERELRQSVETALVEKQAQLDDLTKKLDDASNGSEEMKASEEEASRETEAKAVEQEMVRLIAEAEKLKKELVTLHEELSESKAANEKLVEKCRAAELISRRSNRERNFETEVAAEVAKIRTEAAHAFRDNGGHHSSPTKSMVLADDFPVNGGEETLNDGLSTEQMCDLFIELKASVKEERGLYRELLAEHEDLLALLAQQDLERASLQAALSSLGGEGAVETAINEAEESAVDRFGEYVTLG